MAETRDQVAGLLQDGREPCTDDEVRVEHEAEMRCMWLPKGKRTKLYVDCKKASRSFFGALSLTTKKMRIYPIERNQNLTCPQSEKKHLDRHRSPMSSR